MKTTEKKTWERTKTPGLLRHKSGRYYGRFTVGGKTRFEALKTDLLEVARIRFADARAIVERTRKAARNTAEGAANMGHIATLARQRIDGQTGASDNTKRRYLELVAFLERTWNGFAKLRPDEVTPSAVQRWRDHAITNGGGYMPPGTKATPRPGASGSTVNKAIDMLRRMLDDAVDRGAISANPLAGRRGLKAKDKPHKPKLPEQADLMKVFAEIESVGGKGVPAAEFCRFLALTGCRKGEAAAVLWQDVDLARGVIRVAGTKTDAAKREVPLIPPARSLIEHIRARQEKAAMTTRDGKLYIDPTSRVLGVGEAQKGLTRACAAVGVPRLTHHDLRDAFATACIEAGVDIPTVAAWMGHADGGALLMRVYAHHRRAHSIAQASKVTFTS